MKHIEDENQFNQRALEISKLGVEQEKMYELDGVDHSEQRVRIAIVNMREDIAAICSHINSVNKQLYHISIAVSSLLFYVRIAIIISIITIIFRLLF
jgi:hypothetical protein